MKHRHSSAVRALCSLAGMLFALSLFAADADVTGLVPTIWWDFETKPDAGGLKTANMGSSSISFTSEGTKTYQAGVTNGWALDTASFTPYSAAGTFSTTGQPFTVSAVMTLGTNPNGITLNVRSTAGDMIIRRGADEGSLVVGFGGQAMASTTFLTATFADGDAAYHLVSVVAGPSGTGLYLDGTLVDSTADSTLWSASGVLSQMQFGSHLGGLKTGDVKKGGCIDDLRIHAAALTTAQMTAIVAECGVHVSRYLSISATGESTIGATSFLTSWTLFLDADSTAEAGLVYGTDAALSSPTTNAIGTALAAGSHTASLTGLSPDTAYWWKIVASNGVDWTETPVASFRTCTVLVETDFAKRIPITVSGYEGASTLTNFPVLVRLAANAPAGFDYADCAADGSDLRFAEANGIVLAHEIDTWNTNGESFVWVKVPMLSGTDTAILMCYGASNPAELPTVDPHIVWTATGHRAVWHFAADATESAQGLVANTVTGTPSYDNTGAVGKCWQSAGTACLQYTNDTSWSALGEGSTLTISVWAKFDSASYNYNRILSTMSNWENTAGYELTIQNNKNQITVGSSGRSQYQKVVSPGPMDEMVYLTAVYNADRYADLYVNGVRQEHKQLNPIVQPTEAMAVANVVNGNNIWNGKLDELRLHAAAESADWVNACYDTMAMPTSFAVLGQVESTNPDMPRFGAVSASDENGTATFSVTLSRPGFGGAVPTVVSVFYGTDGATWTELSLGATNVAATLTGTISDLAAGTTVHWYVVATSTQGGSTKMVETLHRSFAAKAHDPVGNYKSFTATVNWNGTPVENIPVALRLSETAILGFSYADVTASGLEILDADGQLLPYEIDTWNTSGESLVWVRLPDYRDGVTFTVRYGTAFANARPAATDVWSEYVAVWHMNEILEDVSTGKHYTPDSSASGWHAYKAAEADSVPVPVTTAAGVTAHPAPLTGTAMNIAYGAGKSNSDVGGFVVPATQTASTTLNGPGFTLSAIVNSQQPANNGRCRAIAFGAAYNDKANLSVGSDNIYCMGGNNHNKPNSSGATGWVCVTEVFGSSSFIYANGANISGAGGNPNLTSISLTKGIGLGGFTDGKQCLDGYLDEARIRNASSTANFIAAEYHAMVDNSALAFSAVASSDTSVPFLGTPTVARNADGSFTISVAVSENIPATIFCTIDGINYTMTTTDAALPATYSATVANLPDGTHAASVHASSGSGTTVSAACPTAFHAGALTVTVLANADEGLFSNGVFRISRADADPTDLPALTFDVALSGAGLAAIVDPGVSALTIPAGEGFVDFAITPALTDAVNADSQLALAVSGANIGQPSGATMVVVNATFDISVRYVSPAGNDSNPGGTPEKPKKTIGAAAALLADVDTSKICTVHVAPGLYPISSPITLTKAIRILGDDPDPSRVIVSNLHQAGWAQNYRVFTINHPDALVANLTMQKGSVGGDWTPGANFYIGEAGGTVSNCVVEAGEQRTNHAGGGGATLDAGLVTHTVFRKNTAPNSSPYSDGGGYRAAVLNLRKSSRAENCLLANNPQSTAVVLVWMGDSSLMRNCTIVDSGIAKTSDVCQVFSSIRIHSSKASVINTVIAGVTNKIDGAACPPSGSVAKFQNGAFDGDATGLPEGTITGTAAEFFNDYANGDYTLNPTGVLVNAGINYDGMAPVDLAGKKRKSGKYIDIGCYECQKEKGFFIFVR